MPPHQSATIRDVAANAGVSIATVSRVLRGTTPVTEATKRRVLKAVDDLQFRPSALGRSLAEGRHAANGIVVPDLSGPYYAELVLGYEEVAGELGRSVLILSTRGRRDPDAMVRGLAARVDGLVILGRTVPDAVVRDIAQRGTPVVAVARPAPDGVDSVSADNARSARALTEHLIGHGHQRFAFIGDAGTSPDAAARWSALRETLTEHGLSPPQAPVAVGLRQQDGAHVAAGLLDRTSRELPDAFVCANDEIALGLKTGLRRGGVRVPADVAITGWDDVMAAEYGGLTTVRQPMRDLGALAARLLDQRLRDGGAPGRSEVLQTDVIVRCSCGCPDRTGPERTDATPGASVSNDGARSGV